MHESMTQEEKDSILSVIRKVEANLRARLAHRGANEAEINSSLYEIQDFTDDIMVGDDNVLMYPEW